MVGLIFCLCLVVVVVVVYNISFFEGAFIAKPVVSRGQRIEFQIEWKRQC